MLTFKITCDRNRKLNVDLIAKKFIEAIGDVTAKDISVKKSTNTVNIQLGKKSDDDISIPIYVEDDEI